MSSLVDRRKHTRFDVPCRLRTEATRGPALRARTLNVSNGGALFPADPPPPVGESMVLRLAVPRETANTFFLEQFAVEAEVVRHVDSGDGDGNAGDDAKAVAVRFQRPLPLDLP